MTHTHTPSLATASARIREMFPDSQAAVLIDALEYVAVGGINSVGPRCAYVLGLIDAFALVGTIKRDEASDLTDLARAVKREREASWSQRA